MTPWFFISEGRYPSEMNMTRDGALFNNVIDNKIPGVVRFYNWDKPAVTIGYHQKEFHFSGSSLEIPIIRRPTGGGAVLHSDDMTFSISARSQGLFKGDVLNTYKLISGIFLKAFKGCGLNAELNTSKGSFSDICFDRTAQLELTCMGRKIMGAAQVRKKGFFLLQGVIPLTVDAGLYERVFGAFIKSPQGVLDIMPEFSEQSFIQAVKELMCESPDTGLKLMLET
jgi:lipoyl(octanoyl) transferase